MAKAAHRPRAGESSISSHTTRRKVLGLAAATLAMPAIARADGPVEWKLATAWAKDARGGGAAAARLADRVAALTGGRLTLRVFAAGDLASAAELFDAVAAGTVEAAHGTATEWQVHDPAFHFFSAVPFGLTGHEHAAWLAFGGGQTLWERAYEPFGVVPFYAGAPGVPAAGWFRNAIPAPADLKDLAMRTGGLAGEVWRRLGVTPVPLPLDAVAEAYLDGKIDAAAVAEPWRDFDLGLASLGARYAVPGFAASGPALQFIVSAATWQPLADDLKAAVGAAATAAASETYAEFTYNNAIALEAMKNAGVIVGPLTDTVIKAAGRETEALIDELASASPMARQVHESFLAYRTRAMAYAPAGDQTALRQRALALSG